MPFLTFFHPEAPDTPDGLPDPSEIRNGVSLERSEMFVLLPLQTTVGIVL